MQPIAVLLDVDASQIYAWLRHLASITEREQALNPLRPQCPALTVSRVEAQYLPLFARHPDATYFGLYTEPPGPNAPFGRLLLLAAGRQQRSGRLRFLIYRYPQFPLEADEVVWLMEQSFPAVFRRWSVLLDMDLPAARRGIAAADTPEFASPPVTNLAPRRAGAPSLECNRWLTEEIAKLPNPQRYHSLMSEWLLRYQAERGRAPADKRGSFRSAARNALAELRKSAQQQETQRRFSSGGKK